MLAPQERPKFLDAQPVDLRVAFGSRDRRSPISRLVKVAAQALGEKGVAGVELDARLVVGGALPSRAIPMSPVATPFTEPSSL